MVISSKTAAPKSLVLAAAAASFLLACTIIQYTTFVRNTNSYTETEWWKQKYKTDEDRGDGYPETHPIQLENVLLEVEESVHYSLDKPGTFAEWAELQQNIPGTGTVRIGEHHRGFTLPMFHELHCVENLRDEVLGQGNNRNKKLRGWGHVQHCANYLRQWALCRADMTLEPGDFALRNFTLERRGATHVCRDWNAVFKVVRQDWRGWDKYWRSHGLTRKLIGHPIRVTG